MTKLTKIFVCYRCSVKDNTFLWEVKSVNSMDEALDYTIDSKKE